MKKIISIGLAGMLICGAVTAQSIKIANTFGGDADSTGGSDLFVFENQKNEDSDGYSNEFTNSTRVSNRLQMDASSSQFDARVRLEFAAGKYNGKESTVRLRGYGRYKPVDAFQIIAGNDFFTKLAVDAGYFAASDDSPKFARILQSGLGALSNLNFGDEDNIFVKLGGGLRFEDGSVLNINKLGLDAGLSFGMKKLFSAGATFQNVTGNNISVGVFAGLNSIENLTLNAGYIYNNTDTDYITKTAKNSVSFTAGYKFSDLGLFAGVDVVCGLGNEYLDNGETKKYQKNDTDLIPFLTKLNISYKATDNLTVGANAKVSMMLGDDDSGKTEVYPNLTYNLSNKFGSVTTGVRMTFDKYGVAKFAVPINWKCTLADIKK